MRMASVGTLVVMINIALGCRGSAGVDAAAHVSSANPISLTEAVAFFRANDSFLASFPSVDSYVLSKQGNFSQICLGSEDEVEHCDLLRRDRSGNLESFFTKMATEVAGKNPLIVFGDFQQGAGDDFLRPYILEKTKTSFGIRTRDAKVVAAALRSVLGYSSHGIPSVFLVASAHASGEQEAWDHGYFIHHSQRVSGHQMPEITLVQGIKVKLMTFGPRSPEVYDGSVVALMEEPRDFSVLPGGRPDKSFLLKPWTPKVESILSPDGSRWKLVTNIEAQGTSIPVGPMQPMRKYF